MTQNASILAHAYPPLGLRRTDAARYIGVSPTKFDEMVKDGRMPPARSVDRARVWNREELEAAFLDLPTQTPQIDNPWDQISG